MNSPTLTYDREANALYVRFSDEPVKETVELSSSVYVDVDNDGSPIGFEILNATSKLLNLIPELPGSAELRDLLRIEAA